METSYIDQTRDLFNILPTKKKKSESCPFNQVSAAVMTSASDEKRPPFNSFSVQGTGGSPTGQIRRIGWLIKILETQVGQFLLGCRCPVSRGIVVQEQHPYIIDTKESQVADITIRHKKAEILQSRRYEFSSILNFN